MKKILIVEDEASLRSRLVSRFQQEEGFAVFESGDGIDALNVAFRAKPDVILLDIILPGMHGLNVLKQIRNEGEGWGKNVPILMLTNLSDSEIVAQAAERGSFDFLVKEDWPLDDIVSKVKQRTGM